MLAMRYNGKNIRISWGAAKLVIGDLPPKVPYWGM
jgi:hypothetical protein